MIKLPTLSTQPATRFQRTSHPRSVVLVNPPFQPLNIPSTGIGHICGAARGAGHRARVADLNYPLASSLVPRMPSLRYHWERGRPDHIGQLLFSSLLFPDGRPDAANVAIGTAEAAFAQPFAPLLAETRELVDEWVSAQRFEEADIVGVTLLNYQLLAGLYLIRKIRQVAKSTAKILVGGFYVSSDNGARLLQRMPEIDACVYGEGELTFLELLDVIDNRERWAEVAGIVFRDDAGSPVTTRPRPLMDGDTLDALPIADYDWVPAEDWARWEVKVPIVSIRGCFWGRCTFCSDFRYNKTTHARSAGDVVSEIRQQAARYRTKRFYFSDLATNDSIERVREISDGLEQLEQDLEFTVLFVPNNITLEMLEALRRGGCNVVQYGIESLNNQLLKKMAKSNTCLENVRCIKLTELAGMQAVSNIIKRFPRETLAEILDNYEKILRFPEVFNGYVFASPVQFHVRAGSGIQRYTEHHDYKLLDRAIHNLLWPPEWSDSIPDIDWQVEVRSEDIALHTQLWALIEKALADNIHRRNMTAYEDDGTHLRLTKYRHRDGGAQSYELSGDARLVYLALEDARRFDTLADELGLDSEFVNDALDCLAAEDLVFRERGRVIATIHRRVSETQLSPLIATAENRADDAADRAGAS